MSAICLLAPVVVAAWPAFSSAVVAAATSLGYEVVSESTREETIVERRPESIQLEIAQSELVTGQLGREQKLSVTRDGVTVTFSRDVRGKASLCVIGTGQSEEELRAMGQELSGAVVQQYVYRKIMDEMRSRGFVVVEENQNEDRSIHLKVRQWES
jgi:hypothetical protein